MSLFKKKKAKESIKIAEAPVEEESPGETKHIKKLDEADPVEDTPVVAPVAPAANIEYKEVPVCVSRTQLDNMIIENNMMLKELMAMANED